MYLKIKTETEEFHGIEFYYIIKPKQQLQMLFIKNSEKCDYIRQSKTLQKCKVFSYIVTCFDGRSREKFLYWSHQSKEKSPGYGFT
mgnify:CR=1 FL=1